MPWNTVKLSPEQKTSAYAKGQATWQRLASPIPSNSSVHDKKFAVGGEARQNQIDLNEEKIAKAISEEESRIDEAAAAT